MLYTQHNNDDDTIKTRSDTLFQKNIPLTLFEKVVCARELETEQNCNILTSSLIAISVSFLFSRAAHPDAREPSFVLGAGFLYHIFSPNSSIGSPEAPSAGCWLSLPQLVTNWSGLQTQSGISRASSAKCWLSLPQIVSKTRLIPKTH